jgi:hypothetical protein
MLIALYVWGIVLGLAMHTWALWFGVAFALVTGLGPPLAAL